MGSKISVALGLLAGTLMDRHRNWGHYFKVRVGVRN